ncbi:hypothetical protein Emed_002243 [Eimeria media]
MLRSSSLHIGRTDTPAAFVPTENVHAGGHAGRLTLSEDGRSLLKLTSLEEAHVYCWLRALAEESEPSPLSAGEGLNPSCPLGCCSDTTCPVLKLHAHAAPNLHKEDDVHSARLLLQWIPELRGVSKVTENSQELPEQAALLTLECLYSGLIDPFVIDIKMGKQQIC